MALTWNKELRDKLIKGYGKKQGLILENKYVDHFSPSYKADYSPSIAFDDIGYIERLSAAHPIQINFYCSPKSEHPLHVRLFQWNNAIPLSDVLPMLENLGLRAYSECPHTIKLKQEKIWISDFAVIYPTDVHIDEVKLIFEHAFLTIYLGLTENDGFNKLILAASLSWREVLILRTYAKYLHQAGFRFSQPYIENALIHNPHLAKDLITLFSRMHDPEQKKSKLSSAEIEKNILRALEAVSSLDEDKIIRRILELIKATLRTNYYQLENNHPKKYLSIKLNSRLIPELPLPVPLYEIFVYATTFEAIHLRNTKVARGGIRWSDRREDFRTEILGLMKAQTVKNSIIVPSGAKGGFVLKHTSAFHTRELLQAEVIKCYKFFICGLLDITDNIVNGKTVHPKNVICYDDSDPYLVVAADKGTATFSDIANDISKTYNYWLGDAFASGGSTGYDHKKMGITARGAWESIKRHFRELNVDVMQTNINVVGIGDMSGDVFGNGMLYSRHIKLVGAFDHRHIFIDPTPDPEISYQERKRLFSLPISSWEDYNPKLISKGGGVFKRSAKTIPVTPQMKQILGTTENTLAPNELIKVILKAPVDLLFNGGIGTYVKSSTESQIDVGDRTNDYCRVNGNELRTKVVGEGGNLGFTQLGRVEYALGGGLINTDFIDNSGGVDCSDHEVNLKILLNAEVQKGNLTEKKRNILLASVTKEMADLVLKDNYAQALVMSFSAYRAPQNLNLHVNYINELESLGILNRKVEFLPDEKTLLERKAFGIGLTRPELAILLAYTKIYVKNEILKTDLPSDPYFSQLLYTAFPASICKKYKTAMQEHRLRPNIIATQLSNDVINEMGITFIYRLQIETGVTIADILRAHAVASHIFGTRELEKVVAALDFKIPLAEQYEMLFHIRNLINLATRWFLHSPYLNENLEKLIQHYSSQIKRLVELIPTLMSGFTKQYLSNLTDQFLKAGLPEEIARRIATYRAIYTSLNIIEVSSTHHFDLTKTAKVYFAAGEKINLVWFRDQIANDAREGHWNVLARLTLRDELDIAQRALTIAIMKQDKKNTDASELVNEWVVQNQSAFARWERLLSMLHASNNVEYTMFFIAIRELMGLIMTSK